MISESEIFIRILVAAILGGLVGLERERQNQPAGLRTHIILVTGATLAMVLSINMAIIWRNLAPNGDPARLAAQVISGIGFLGAGAILRFGPNVKGLTTATSLWTMAIVGMAVGAGYYNPAIATTLLLLVALILINRVEDLFIRSYMNLSVNIKAIDRVGLVDEVKDISNRKGRRLVSTKIKKNLEDQRINIEIVIRTSNAKALDLLVAELSQVIGIKSFEIN